MRLNGEFSTRFGTIKYFTEGSGEDFVVMLQGWATDRSIYDGIVRVLAEKYTVIFPALFGFGESDEPTDAMSVSDYAESINLLLENLGVKRAHFFCHSFGGRVFFKLNAMRSRFTSPTSVMLCDVAGIVPKKSFAKRIKMKLYKLGKRIFPCAVAAMRSKIGSADYNASSEVMKKTLVLAVNEDLRHLFSQIDVPALIMWGRDDEAVPLSDAYLIESAVPDSAVIVFERSGHFPFLTEEGRFLAVTRSFFAI